MSNRRRPQPAPPTPAPRKLQFDLRVLSAVLDQAQQAGAIPRREFKAPQLPPGVLPKGARSALASDNAIQNYGFLNNSGGMCGLGFPGYSYLSELSQKGGNRAPSETIAMEATREWIELRGASSEDKLKELNSCMEDMGVREQFYDCSVQDGLFGRAGL